VLRNNVIKLILHVGINYKKIKLENNGRVPIVFCRNFGIGVSVKSTAVVVGTNSVNGSNFGNVRCYFFLKFHSFTAVLHLNELLGC